eukprot:gene4841-8426_t
MSTKFMLFYAVAFMMTYKMDNIWKIDPEDLTAMPDQRYPKIQDTFLSKVTFMFQKVVNLSSNFMFSIILWIFFVEVWSIIRFFGFKFPIFDNEEIGNHNPTISKVFRPRILSR